jgi:predicted nuclease of predicted toxin-antitoxin system
VKFKIDENLPDELADLLRSLGYEADTVGDEDLTGSADAAVIAAAHLEERIVLTLDKGIANIVRFPNQVHSGIVLFRPGSLDRKAVLRFIRERLETLLRLDLARKVTVVTDERIRVR